MMCLLALLAAAFSAALLLCAQNAREHGVNVTARLESQTASKTAGRTAPLPPAVLWLEPLPGTAPLVPAPVPDRTYTLLQHNRMFTPHLLVVPVGSLVRFPNKDPFFHNVFSLFDGKRFDLGLYEAGKTKDVLFGREGISYIFCNIHSEMSAVVIALSTPLYAVADSTGSFLVPAVPPGDYNMHLWVEGETQAVLDKRTRRVHITPLTANLGTTVVNRPPGTPDHTNKFGQPYDSGVHPVY